ncbi:hypothetical protein P3S68_023758 [Capsicum galapagoense]
MILFLLFVAFPIILIFLLPKAKKGCKNTLPTGPIGLPLIGNLHQYDTLTPHLYFWKLSKKYGKIFSLKLGSATMVVVSSAKLAKEALKTQDLVFRSRPSILGQQKLSYNGRDMVFAPYNDYWREMRKICVLHLFSLKKLQLYNPIREDEVARMIKTRKHLSKLLLLKFERNFKDLDEFYQDLIEQHKNPNRPKSMEGDIVDLLLQLKKEQSTPIDITLEDIKGLLMRSCSSIGNDGLDKESKSQEEIRNSIGIKGIVKEDDVKNMPYFKAMIKEALRLYPPVPLLVPRESMGNSTLEGYEIQARTILQVNSWAIARDAEILKNLYLIPFGAGRRGCPGIALGIASVELALSNLLYAFDWELPHGMKKEDVDTNVRTGITMHKKNELCLIAKNYF